MNRLLTLVCALSLSVGALAQSDLGPKVESALETARSAMREALATYERQYPDRPLWQEAIRAARNASDLAPGESEPLRLLAEIYSRSSWYGPAWQAWEAYLDTGAELGSEDAPLFAAVGGELGYGAYSRGDLELALEYYQRVIEVVPYDREAHVWAGRILLEEDQPEEALRYWQTAAERDPTDQGAAYFLQLAQNQADYGPQAGSAFQEGVSLYSEGQVQAASSRFIAAARANESFDEAYAWAGRTLLESGYPERAIPYWEALAERNPDDEGAAYFLELSRDQAAWGLDAATLFREGVAAYEANDLETAAERFRAAAEAEAAYAEAWAWLGRVAFDGGDYQEAEAAYERAADLQPENETYRYFFEESQRRAADG